MFSRYFHRQARFERFEIRAWGGKETGGPAGSFISREAAMHHVGAGRVTSDEAALILRATLLLRVNLDISHRHRRASSFPRAASSISCSRAEREESANDSPRGIYVSSMF